MQTTAIGDYIRHNSGANGKVTGLSPDGSIADVYVLSTGKTENWVLSLCSPDNDSGPKYRVVDAPNVQPVVLAKGPIIGAILISNLITGVIAFIVLLISGVIH